MGIKCELSWLTQTCTGLAKVSEHKSAVNDARAVRICEKPSTPKQTRPTKQDKTKMSVQGQQRGGRRKKSRENVRECCPNEGQEMEKGRKRERERERESEREKDRHTDRQRNREAEKYRNREAEKYKNRQAVGQKWK
ncbi:hypothetical protein PoB_001918100 [Plakobranchus ocellatus]|uniref:Uncharacterized protein n=1 Tax=Plakobranchus ocellatus TaxID=259542 RepID=A0AAV3Z030_9GAST|nr:hypothetical protein PoB_001918100 [Plakobranchus ocellatus]